VPISGNNLVVRAVEKLRQTAHVSAGAAIHLIKRIPAASGFGGGSSDAAAVLLAANRAWQLGWSRPRLARLAAELGSDIAFFFGPAAAIGRGRGEIIEPLACISPLHLVVVRPPEGLATARVYHQGGFPAKSARLEPLVKNLAQGNCASAAQQLVNHLQPAAESLTPWIARLRKAFDRLDCLGHQMSGSGTGYFGICRDARHARRVTARLRGQNLGYVCAARTLGTAHCIPVPASESEGGPHGNH
jgi:4-diphosphocytidyl-2-C-methyl-D-erythritol kinase